MNHNGVSPDRGVVLEYSSKRPRFFQSRELHEGDTVTAAVNPGTPAKLGSNSNQLHPRHRGFFACVTTRGFARLGVGGDDVAFTLARIFSLAIVVGSRSLAGALPFARVRTKALDLRRLGGRARGVLGTYQAGGESQCDRGREHRSCYSGLLHR